MDIQRTLLFILFLALVVFRASAQGDPPAEDFDFDDCPDITYCFTSTTLLGAISYSPELNTPEVNACFGSGWNPRNLKFVATSEEIDMTLSWSDDRFMKISILDECYGGGICIEGADCDDGGEIQIYTDELIIGHSYILAVDNCETGSFLQWPFEISISPGPRGDFESINSIYLEEANSCDNGLEGERFCYGINLNPRIFGNNEDEIEHLENAGATWNFIISGQETFSFSTDNLLSYNLNFSNPGSYSLILESVNINCIEFDVGVQYDFEITEVNEEYGVFDVCAHDLEDWVPDYLWLGPGISEPGDYQYWFNDECGCPYSQSITVNRLEEVREVVILELCPDDYPFEYLEEYELSYFPDDYDLMLTFERASLQEDSQGIECDSLVHLFVINENPEDRCSSCMLPLSLEDGKIVYCVNFDNGTYDSSGKANPIEAVGVGYDNNGPASNRLWEAEFDGRDDYVRIPDQEDLNTSGFAIDIRFNKDEPFDNGPFETILSKGDTAEDNLRFQMGLEEKTENSYDLIVKLFTATQEYIITAGDLSRNIWYGATLVVENDSISLYLDGLLHQQLSKTEDLKGNENDLYLATGEDADMLSDFYIGRLDDFKYWKQKLSGQDVLYLYYPEKEFEVYIDFFQSCCDTNYFQGIEISEAKPLDTIVSIEASPTGYDSVYFLRHIPAGQGPQLIEAGFFQDITVIQEVSCKEVCTQSVSWLEPDLSLFEDACGVSNIVSSHNTPLELNADLPYVEVVYSVSNNCGDESNYSFIVELECEAEDYVSIPEGNDFILSAVNSCEEESDSVYCAGRTVRLEPMYFDSLMGSTSNNYSDIDSLKFRISVRSGGLTSILESQNPGGIDLSLTEAGSYEICFDRIDSACETVYPGICKEIEVVELFETDYGNIRACPGSVEAVLPGQISQELRTELNDNPDAGLKEVYYETNCGCRYRDVIVLDYATDPVPAQFYIELCEGETLSILGEEFGTDTWYEETEIIFEAASMGVSSQGETCDSIVSLTIAVLEDIERVIDRQICEGSDLEGYTQSGSYIDGFTAENGCDSTRILNLEVLPELETMQEVSICEGENYEGYSEAGVYEDEFVSEAGCDSIRILQLSIVGIIETELQLSICEGETYEGLSEAGSYVIKATGHEGCDSIVELTLTVLENAYTEIDESICPGEEYMGYTQTGVYENEYMAVNGCDSTVVLYLDLLDEEDPACQTSSVEETSDLWSVYPNPTEDILQIEFDGNEKIKSLQLIDITGKVVMLKREELSRLNISGLSAGVYYLRIESVSNRLASIRILKI